MLNDGANDFDFEIGKWRVSHRRLRERFVGGDDWETFDGTAEMHPVLGGRGNVEDNVLNCAGGPVRAMAIRSYDPETRSWAIWWLSSADPHRLDVPVVGKFENGVGSFFAVENTGSRLVLTRFLWLETTSRAPRWEQAMSLDDGETWETNWTMDFSRVASVPR